MGISMRIREPENPIRGHIGVSQYISTPHQARRTKHKPQKIVFQSAGRTLRPDELLWVLTSCRWYCQETNDSGKVRQWFCVHPLGVEPMNCRSCVFFLFWCMGCCQSNHHEPQGAGSRS